MAAPKHFFLKGEIAMGFTVVNKQRVDHTTQFERDRATEHVMLMDVSRVIKQYRENFLDAVRNIMLDRDRYERHIWLMVTWWRKGLEDRVGIATMPTAVKANGNAAVAIVADRDMDELTDNEWIFICSDVYAFSQAARLFRLMASK